MKKFVLIATAILGCAAAAGARIDRYNDLMAVFVNPDTGVMLDTSVPANCAPVQKTTDKINDAVTAFSNQAKHSPSDFAVLVHLTGLAMPCMEFPDAAQIIDGLKDESPAMNKAFQTGLKQLKDECRKANLLDRLASVSDGPQDTVAVHQRPGVQKPIAKPFDFAACVARRR